MQKSRTTQLTWLVSEFGQDATAVQAGAWKKAACTWLLSGVNHLQMDLNGEITVKWWEMFDS